MAQGSWYFITNHSPINLPAYHLTFSGGSMSVSCLGRKKATGKWTSLTGLSDREIHPPLRMGGESGHKVKGTIKPEAFLRWTTMPTFAWTTHLGSWLFCPRSSHTTTDLADILDRLDPNNGQLIARMLEKSRGRTFNLYHVPRVMQFHIINTAFSSFAPPLLSGMFLDFFFCGIMD